MKILLIINSYAAQFPLLQKIIELYKPLQSCSDSFTCCEISLALQQGEQPSFPHAILPINNTSPHRRWFLSAFQAYEILGAGYDWYLILDGDTFVFLKQLEVILSEYTDPENVSWYIGGSTEAHTSILNHGVFPYGGGGVIISNHALRIIYPTKNTCLRKYEAIYGGDELLYRCFADIGVKPTISPSFHQCDMRGDITGLFETFFPTAGVATLHHLGQTLFGYQPMYQALKQLAQASNTLNRLFVRRALLESACPQNGADRNKFFILTHGISLVEYNPYKAERDPHIFDNQVIVKSHKFWGNRDYEHSFLYGKRLVHPSRALVDRQYMKRIREDEKYITQEFQNCVVKTKKANGRSFLSCDQNCIYDIRHVDSSAADNISVSNASLSTIHVQMMIGVSSVLLFLFLSLKKWRYTGAR